MTPGRSGRQKKFKHTPRKSSRKLPLAIGLLAIVVVAIVVFYVYGMNGLNSSNSPGGDNSNVPSGNIVLLQTSMGNITIQLRDDRPITTSNFKNLIEQGVYDDTIFHRVISGFMIQGGDPTGTGQGDPSIPTIQDEVVGDNKNNYGTIAMAKMGNADGSSVPNSASSQFYINVANNNWLDSEYTVFGTVISGMDVTVNISNVPTNGTKPVTDVTLIKAEIIS
jgi:peptidylprolyl isomerase